MIRLLLALTLWAGSHPALAQSSGEELAAEAIGALLGVQSRDDWRLGVVRKFVNAGYGVVDFISKRVVIAVVEHFDGHRSHRLNRNTPHLFQELHTVECVFESLHDRLFNIVSSSPWKRDRNLHFDRRCVGQRLTA